MTLRFIIALGIVLPALWMLWSGHTEPFMLLLGSLSCAFVVWLSFRMGILDSEALPYHLGIRPFTRYLPWLVKEIIWANIEVCRRILGRELRIRPKMVKVRALQRTELGRVILANSITLTPGTVSVSMQGPDIWVHALSPEEAEEDVSGDMNRRVQELEGQ